MNGKKNLVRNVAFVAMASYLEAAVGLATGVIIARVLGPSEYGHYAFLIWLCGVLILASNNALTTSSVKFIAEARGADDPALAAAVAHRIRRIQAVSSSVVVVAFVAIAWALPQETWNEDRLVIVPIAIVAVWARAGFWMIGAIGKGYERFGPENGALAINALLNLLLVIVLAASDSGTTGYFVLYAALGLLSNALVRFLISRSGATIRKGPIPTVFATRMNRHLIETGVLTALNIATLRTVEMSMLKAYSDVASVGHFAIASSLTKGAVDVFAGGIAAVLLPAMSRSFGSGVAGSLRTMISESTRYYWFVGLAIAGGGFVVTESVVHLLYGSRFDEAVPVVVAQLAAAGLTVINGTAAATLTASDRQRDRIAIGVVGLAFNLIAGFLLIPRYGALGAAASFGLTQALEGALSFARAQRAVSFSLPYGAMIRLAAAAGLATVVGRGAVALFDGPLAFLPGGVAFVLAYAFSSIVFRAWRAGDFALMAAIAVRAGPPGRTVARALTRLQDRFAASPDSRAT
jgi:O-antigen/teichoic acid export membrane protein